MLGWRISKILYTWQFWTCHRIPIWQTRPWSWFLVSFAFLLISYSLQHCTWQLKLCHYRWGTGIHVLVGSGWLSCFFVLIVMKIFKTTCAMFLVFGTQLRTWIWQKILFQLTRAHYLPCEHRVDRIGIIECFKFSDNQRRITPFEAIEEFTHSIFGILQGDCIWNQEASGNWTP